MDWYKNPGMVIDHLREHGFEVEVMANLDAMERPGRPWVYAMAESLMGEARLCALAEGLPGRATVDTSRRWSDGKVVVRELRLYWHPAPEQLSAPLPEPTNVIPCYTYTVREEGA